jgi:hypothetical protein
LENPHVHLFVDGGVIYKVSSLLSLLFELSTTRNAMLYNKDNTKYHQIPIWKITWYEEQKYHLYALFDHLASNLIVFGPYSYPAPVPHMLLGFVQNVVFDPQFILAVIHLSIVIIKTWSCFKVLWHILNIQGSSGSSTCLSDCQHMLDKQR